ncbi:MAG: T9SS type A sorting domain-containing protein [Bacteroidia bacterium]|nr:T9SS type A sorting domain-containing protein [Bacteroidia bacterium]
MKKVLHLLSYLLLLKAWAQVPTCSLDPAFIALNKYGIWPDSATNFVTGTVGINYLQNITVKVPKDTNTQIGKFCFNRVVVSTPSNVTNYNLPPGLMFGSSTASLSNGTINGAPSLKFPGNANNCASIYGTPTQSGTFVLSFKVDTYATYQPVGSCPNNPNVNGGTNLNTTYINYYKIIIYPATSIHEWNSNPFESLKATLYPNPGHECTTFIFNSPSEWPYVIDITDLNGKILNTIYATSVNGLNEVTLDLKKFQSGIYLVNLRMNHAVTVYKLVVEGR